MNRPAHPHVFATQLGREWECLRHRRSALDHARAWQAIVHQGPLADALADLTDLDQLIGATGRPARPGCRSRLDVASDSGRRADGALLELVELAQHDQLAGRVVIQRLLPGLIVRAARYRSRRDDIDPAELVVAAAWIALHRFDTTTRRHHVAASLISDATYQAFRQPSRRRAADEQAVPSQHFDECPATTTSPSAFERLADVIRTARLNGVPAGDLQLVRELIQIGSASNLAALHGVTPRTIRNRRDRALAHIRAAVRAA